METDLLRLSFLPEKCMFELIERPYKFGDYGGEGKDAMNKVKRKLKNQTGASITFALLLFLVCAVLSSVIIVAATASSGRMSGIAEMDQRYYSVSSASELLKDLLNEKMVAIVTVTTTTRTTQVIEDIRQDPIISEDWVVYIVPNKTTAELAAMSADEFRTASGNSTSGVQKIDAKGFSGSVSITSLLNDAAYQYYRIRKSTPPSASSRDLSLVTNIPKPAGVDADPLAVTIKEIMDTSGNISLTLLNTNGNPYTRELQFTLMPSVTKPGKETPPIISPTDPPDPSNYTSTEVETKIQFLPLKWKLL